MSNPDESDPHEITTQRIVDIPVRNGPATPAQHVFIEESGEANHLKSNSNRRKIRSQARSSAAKTYSVRFVNWNNSAKKYHHRVYPPRKQKGSDQETQDDENTMLTLLSPSLKGYERARMEFGFDISSLAALTSVHMGVGSSLAMLEPRVSQWVGLDRESSYLEFVPIFYESSDLVKSVVDCVLAQYRHLLLGGSKSNEVKVLLLYGKALKLLQDALCNPESCLMEETMLATSVMQLREIVDSSATNHWSKHFRGLMTMIERKGPGISNSSLGLSILATHLGPIIAECFNHQLYCFLEDPSWSGVMSAMVNGDSVLLDLFSGMYRASRFARRAKNYLLGPLHDPNLVNELITEGFEIKRLSKFPSQYQRSQEGSNEAMTYQTTAASGNEPVTWEADIDELLGATWASHISVNRVLVALRPLGCKTRSLEFETQKFAHSLLNLQARRLGGGNDANRDSVEPKIVHTHTAVSAQLVIKTHQDWNRAIRGEPEAVDSFRNTINLDIYRHWIHALANKQPTKGLVVSFKG